MHKLNDLLNFLKEKASLKFWGVVTIRFREGKIVKLETSEVIQPGNREIPD